MTKTGFHDYFSGIYLGRWEGLKKALLAPSLKLNYPLFNQYSEYYLDEASVQAALALQARPGDTVLDLCAAPGGKSLLIWNEMKGEGSLVANEMSSARRRRLQEVIQLHVPSDKKEGIKITGYDGNQFGIKRLQAFDRVLLDAPCSSERHCLEDDAEMSSWKPSRTEQLAKRQYSLLCSAILTAKPGGTIVYSTCSISPLENDSVIERALQRKSDLIELDSNTIDLEKFEKTKVGFQIFPDRFEGKGPMYIARLKVKS